MDTASQQPKRTPFGGRPKRIVARTVEGHSIRRGAAIAIVLGLSAMAFFGGNLFGRHRSGQSDSASRSIAVDQGSAASNGGEPSLFAALPDLVGEPRSRVGGSNQGEYEDPPVSSERPAATELAPVSDSAGVEEAVNGLAYEAFSAPVVLVSAATDPALGNAVGFSVDTYGDNVGAVTVNLVATGSAGASVAIHKGDRPDQSVRFVIPANGRLMVPQLVAAVDDQGRVGVTADEQVTVEVVGLGVHVATERSATGRFVDMDSVRLGSLVTAVDGRDLVLDLNELPGLRLADVGQAILRLNANVGTNGGTVTASGTVSSGPVMWPAPPRQNLGLGGTALLQVSPDAAGLITINYLGGSVLTADLVGYYTSEAAPVSSAGLLVIEPPTSEDLLPGGSEVPIATNVEAGSELLLLSAANGPSAGPVIVLPRRGPDQEHLTFNVAPNQVRISPVWASGHYGDPTYVSAPDGAVVTIWRLGHFTS